MTSTKFLLILAIVTVQCSGQIVEVDIPDGNHKIKSFPSELFLTSKDNGGPGWSALGKVTAEIIDIGQPNEQIWTLYKTPFYPSQGEYQLRFIRTNGRFGFNNVDIEQPRPGTFPVDHYWRLRDAGNNRTLINSLLMFDWDDVGQNKCLQNNGVGVVAFEECDANNVYQQWVFK